MRGCSFSARMKAELAASYPRSYCCRGAMLDALYRFRPALQQEAEPPLQALIAHLTAPKKHPPQSSPSVCPGCLAAFLKGAFLAVGRITDPARSYHLEFAPPAEAEAALLAERLTEAGIPPARRHRRAMPILYYKGSEPIQDLLHCIGAQKQAFAFVNETIRKDLRNSANRRANCDAANLSRTAKAVSPQLHAIRFLASEGLLGELPDELRETAELRLAAPEASLPELARMHPASMTKSGVNHRLQKILQFAVEKNGGKEFS